MREYQTSWEPVAHTYNPSYSEIRKIEVQSQEQANRLYLEKTQHRKGLVV
jgi:hypothetical protein